MRALYLNKDNAEIISKTVDSEPHHEGEFLESIAIVKPRFFYYESWTDFFGFKKVFDQMEEGEDGNNASRRAMDSKIRKFQEKYVRVEFKLSEEFEKELNSHYNRVLIRPNVAYVRNIWGSGYLGLSDLYVKEDVK